MNQQSRHRNDLAPSPAPDPVTLRCVRYFARAKSSSGLPELDSPLGCRNRLTADFGWGDDPRSCNTTAWRTASFGSKRRGLGRASFEARAKTRERLRTTEQIQEFVLRTILNP